jgi:hypothetical protein
MDATDEVSHCLGSQGNRSAVRETLVEFECTSPHYS